MLPYWMRERSVCSGLPVTTGRHRAALCDEEETRASHEGGAKSGSNAAFVVVVVAAAARGGRSICGRCTWYA